MTPSGIAGVFPQIDTLSARTLCDVAGVATIPNTPTRMLVKDRDTTTDPRSHEATTQRHASKRKADTSSQPHSDCTAEYTYCNHRYKRTRLVEDKEKQMSYLEYDDSLCVGHEDERIIKIIADIAEVKRTLGYINQGINKILQQQQSAM